MQTYSLRPGDYLSLVAARYCGSADKWPDIWHATPGIANPNVVPVGLRVNISCTGNYSAPADPPAHYTARHAAGTDPWDGQHHECGDGDHDGFDMPCSYLHNGSGNPGYQPRHSYSSGRSYRRYYSSSSTYHGSSGCQAHIIADESGGNPHAVNGSSGAGGLYQFLPSTWHALGHSGLPENASVAEQNQAYYQQVAQSGYSAWAASGGC
jgi:hypothetical protein